MDHTDFGTSLLEEILPYHLEYYLGVKKDIDFGGPHGDDEDTGSDPGDDSEEEKPKKPKGKKTGKKPGGDAGQLPKQDCKQQ